MNALIAASFAFLAITSAASGSIHGLDLHGAGAIVNPYALSPIGPSGIVTGQGAHGPSGTVTGAGAVGPSGIVTGKGPIGPTGPAGHGPAAAIIVAAPVAPVAAYAPVAPLVGLAGHGVDGAWGVGAGDLGLGKGAWALGGLGGYGGHGGHGW